MIDILLIVAVICILIILVVKYEKFTVNDPNDPIYNSKSTNCKYVPWGPSLDFCINNCKGRNKEGTWDITGDACTIDICKDKCMNCEDQKNCEWINVWSKQKKKNLITLQKKMKL